MSVAHRYFRKSVARDIRDKDFKNPAKHFYPRPFYFLNHTLEEKELRRQAKEHDEKGFGGYIMCSRYGLETPCMSENWMKAIDVLVDEAEKRGLEPWLNDEDPFHSGHSGGEVEADHPEFELRCIAPFIRQVKGGRRIRLDLGWGWLVRSVAVPVRKGRTIKPKIMDWMSDVQKKQAHSNEFNPEGGTPDCAHAINLRPYIGWFKTQWGLSKHSTGGDAYYMMKREFEHCRYDAFDQHYVLEWDAPKGDWIIFAALVTRRGHGATTNPAAMAYYIKTTHERYVKRYKEKLGKSIPGILTDEPSIGYYAYDRHIEKYFRKKFGYRLAENLHYIFLETPPWSWKVRNDYKEALGDLYIESFFVQIRKYCEKNRMVLIGHINCEELLAFQPLSQGDFMRAIGELHIPGTDLIVPAIGDRKHAILNVGQKMASSVAAQKGSDICLNESYAASGWDLTMSTMKRIADWLISSGTNGFIPHATYYSHDGLRKFDCNASMFFQISFWEKMRHLTDYMARLAYLFQGGKEKVEIGVVFPYRTFNAFALERHGSALEVEKAFSDTIISLEEHQIPFHIVREQELEKPKLSGRGLRVGKCTYDKLVICGESLLSKESANGLKAFAKKGGKVFAAQGAQVFDYKKGTRRARKLAGMPAFENSPEGLEKLCDQLQRTSDIPFRIESENREAMRAFYKEKAGNGIYHFFNASRKKVRAKIDVKDGRFPSLRDARCGERFEFEYEKRDGGFSFSWNFEESESVIIITSKTRLAGLKNILKPSKKMEIGNWKARPLDDNTLVLTDWQAKMKGPFKKVELLQAYRIFDIPYCPSAHGVWGDYPPIDWKMKPAKLTYKTSFDVKEKPAGLKLVTDRQSVIGSWKVFINRKEARFRKGRFRWAIENIEADILKFVKRGRNEVVLEVTADDKRGGLLDYLRLYGDFELDSKLRIMKRKDAYPAGDWAKMGFPHYTGAFEYRSEIDWQGGPAEIHFDKVAELVEVFVNGKSAGIAGWAPWKMDISDYLKKGRNRIALSVTNTQMNAMEGSPRPSGLIGNVWLRY